MEKIKWYDAIIYVIVGVTSIFFFNFIISYIVNDWSDKNFILNSLFAAIGIFTYMKIKFNLKHK